MSLFLEWLNKGVNDEDESYVNRDCEGSECHVRDKCKCHPQSNAIEKMKPSKETELWLVDILECIKYTMYDGGAGVDWLWFGAFSQYSDGIGHCGI